jgi:hypothetical protein
VVATGVRVPGWLANTTDLIGGLTIPLMLFALGVSLARLQVGSLERSLALSLVRLLGGAALGFGIGWALGLSDAARGVLAIQSAMPVAVFNYSLRSALSPRARRGGGHDRALDPDQLRHPSPPAAARAVAGAGPLEGRTLPIQRIFRFPSPFLGRVWLTTEGTPGTPQAGFSSCFMVIPIVVE